MLLISVYVIQSLTLLIDPFSPPVLATTKNEYSGSGGAWQFDIVGKSHFACLRSKDVLTSRHGSLVFNHRMSKVYFRAGKHHKTAGILVVPPCCTNTIPLCMEYGIYRNRYFLFTIEIISKHTHAEEYAIMQSFYSLLFVRVHARDGSILIVGLI